MAEPRSVDAGNEPRSPESTPPGGGGVRTNTSIIDEHIKALLPSSESLDGGLDGGEVGQVELQELELAAAIRGRLFDHREGFLGL